MTDHVSAVRAGLTRWDAWVLALFALSLPVKLIAAQHLPWDMDYVPVLARPLAFLEGGAFPSVGTLSSVAAYNMPMLGWLHLPALLMTRDAATALLLTGFAWSLLSTWGVYRLGAEWFRPAVGVMAAALFTFSDVGVSGAYTSWAQLWLPGFFAWVMVFLGRWQRHEDGRALAVAWVTATAAFMTHFAAILLYPAIAAYWVLARPPLRWRGVLMGVGVSALLLAPYALVQFERDFVDVRAFLTRRTTVAAEVMAEYAYLKPENQAPALAVRAILDDEPATTDARAPIEEEAAPTPIQEIAPRPRWLRAVDVALSVPSQVIAGWQVLFGSAPRTLAEHVPLLFSVHQGLTLIFMGAFYGGALVMSGLALRSLWRERHLRALTAGDAGPYLLLLTMTLVIIGGLILTRSPAWAQGSYYLGLFGWQWVLIAAALVTLASRWLPRRGWLMLACLVALSVSLSSADRVLRVMADDPATPSPAHYWRYASIRAAVDWIAADWEGGTTLTVAYDLLPENAALWWVAPWHTVDPLYRIGAPYDFLLRVSHGLRNRHQHPIGLADDPDYIVTTLPGLQRYELSAYDVARFGALAVLKPMLLANPALIPQPPSPQGEGGA